MDEIFNDINSMESIPEVGEDNSFSEEITDLEYKEIIGEESPLSDKELFLPDIEEEVLEEIYKTGKKKKKRKNKKKRNDNNPQTDDPVEETDLHGNEQGYIQHFAEEETGTFIDSENISSKKDIILQKYNEAFKDSYEKSPKYISKEHTQGKESETKKEIRNASLKEESPIEASDNSEKYINKSIADTPGTESFTGSNNAEKNRNTAHELYEINSIKDLTDHITEIPLQNMKGVQTEPGTYAHDEKKTNPLNENRDVFPSPGSFAMELYKNSGQTKQHLENSHSDNQDIKKVKTSEYTDKQKERDKKEDKQESFSRKFSIKGDGSQFTSHLADAGRGLSAALLLASDDPDSIDYEQRENAYYISSVARDVFDSLGNMGLKASAKMAKDYSYNFEKGTLKAKKLIAEGVISKDELGTSDKGKTFKKELEQRGVSKKDAKYISSHRKEIKDAIESKIILNDFSKHMEDKDNPNVFAKII